MPKNSVFPHTSSVFGANPAHTKVYQVPWAPLSGSKGQGVGEIPLSIFLEALRQSHPSSKLWPGEAVHLTNPSHGPKTSQQMPEDHQGPPRLQAWGTLRLSFWTWACSSRCAIRIALDRSWDSKVILYIAPGPGLYQLPPTKWDFHKTIGQPNLGQQVISISIWMDMLRVTW